MSVNLNEMILPIELEKDSEYMSDLKKKLDEYYEMLTLKLVKREASDTFINLEKIKENIDLIEQCLNNYYNDRLALAYENIKNILAKYIDVDNNPFIVATIDKNYAFRGMAPDKIRMKAYSGDEVGKEYEKMLKPNLTFFRARVDNQGIKGKDMLHIPFDKREIISTQRFSIPGIPCVYLSTSSYGTWIEMGWPESSQFQVSSIKIPTDLRVLNLCIQDSLINGQQAIAQNDEENKRVQAYAEIFPLVIATSYRIKQEKRKFKSEYIISQIIMQVCNEIGIQGVAYLSKRTKDFYAYPQAVNLAIAIPNNCKSLYWDRANEVKITEPVRFIDFLKKGIRNEGENQKYLSYVNEIFKNKHGSDICLGDKKVKYIMTDFSAFDEYILKQDFLSFTELQKKGDCMKTGIIVFAYNRSWHLQQVLNGLQNNTGVDKLYIFQDGLKCEAHRQEWEATQKVINQIEWCETVYELSKVNKGLSKSILYGVNKVFEENDAVIVLEDDCVPSPNFVTFMKQCFEKYKDDKQIYSVSGYSWPIELTKSDSDIYFCGRISSWGWGTWKDRWQQYDADNMIIKKMKENQEMSQNIATWGNDLEKMLVGNIKGESDSWAVYWALSVIKNKGVCINPYCSLIKNIGMDGTGRHCGMDDRFDVLLDVDENYKTFKFPSEVNLLPTVQAAFAELYGSHSAIDYEGTKGKVIVYGLGNFYFANEKVINQDFKVVAFIDRNKHGWFAGKKIIEPSAVSNIQFDKIIIAVQSIQQCINISKMMIEQFGIDYRKLELAHNLYGRYTNYFQSINVLQDGTLLVSAKGISVKVCSEDEFNNVYEVLIGESYHYFINNQRKDVVLDIGMNIGDSTLYFLNNNKVEKVYAFEPFLKTYLVAQENLKEFISNQDKLEIFQYGISNRNEKRTIGFNQDMTCGQSTISDVREFAHQTYQTIGLIQKENEISELIQVRKASEVVAPIIQKHAHNNIVLKMDCEGEEYCILEDLSNTDLLDKFDFIMLEWHHQGKEMLLYYLEKAGFSYWCNDKSEKMGLVYAINTRL